MKNLKLVALYVAFMSLFLSCGKDKYQSNTGQKTFSSSELVGVWDKKDSVRLSFRNDGTFTAQRWVAAANSFADNFALQGKYTMDDNTQEVTLNVEYTNLAHLWSKQDIKIIKLKASLSSDKRTVSLSDVRILPDNLDVKEPVIQRLLRDFVKSNDNPLLSTDGYKFSAISTFQSTLPVGTKPWSYKNNAFEFTFTNYQLGAKTTDQDALGMAITPMGQHVHVLVNGAPYLAAGTNPYKYSLADGDYTIVAAASRSYHEVFKNTESVIMAKIKVAGGNEVSGSRTAITEPDLYLSRPKGEYKMATGEHKKILLDYIVSDEVRNNMETKYVVRILVDQTPFISSKWVPYIVENVAKAGKHTVTMQLYDVVAKKVLKTVSAEITLV